VKVGTKFHKLDDIGTRVVEFMPSDITDMHSMVKKLHLSFHPFYTPRQGWPATLPFPALTEPAKAIYFLTAGKYAAHSEESFLTFLAGPRKMNLNCVLDLNNFGLEDQLDSLPSVNDAIESSSVLNKKVCYK
jgi:hypothetical protein